MPSTLGRLDVGQLLEVPQGQNFPVDGVQVVERFLEDELHLGALDGLGDGGEPPQQLGRDRHAGGLGHGALVQRHFPAGVAHLGAQVVAVQ